MRIRVVDIPTNGPPRSRHSMPGSPPPAVRSFFLLLPIPRQSAEISPRFEASPLPGRRGRIRGRCWRRSRVRGAYALKFQPFWLAGEVVDVADFMLPVSEGIVDRSYTQVAARLLLDAIQRHPLLYGLGMGGFDQAVARFLKAAGWQMFTVPFFFYVVHPLQLPAKYRPLAQGWSRRTLLDLLAFSGLGWIAGNCWKLLHAARSGRGPGRTSGNSWPIFRPGAMKSGCGPAALRHVLAPRCGDAPPDVSARGRRFSENQGSARREGDRLGAVC